MSNDIQVFEKAEFGSVRAIMIDDAPWFVAKDVCSCLDIQNSRDAVSKLRSKDKADVALTDTSSNGVEQKRNMTVVSENGLYELVFSSRKPEAQAFKYWVFDEVLPSIRTKGYYVAPTPASQDSDRERMAMQDLQALKIILSNSYDSDQITMLQDKLYQHDTGRSLLASVGIKAIEAEDQDDYVTPTQLGIMMGLGDHQGNQVNKLLAMAG